MKSKSFNNKNFIIFIVIFVFVFFTIFTMSIYIGLYALLCYIFDYTFTWGKGFAFWVVLSLFIYIFRMIIKK